MATPLVPLEPADVGVVHELIRRFESHWRVPLPVPRSELEEDFAAPHLDLAVDSRSVWAGDRLAGYALVSHTPSGERLERAHVDGMVDPELMGNGYGRRLLAWSIERAVERLRERDPSIPWFVRAYQWDWVHPSFRLYERFGLVPVRYFEDMVRPLDTPHDTPTPADVEIEPWAQCEPEIIREVRNTAFADHWGSTPMDRKAWEHLLARSEVRPDLSWIAIAGGEVVGVCLNSHYPEDEEATGRRDGWIDQLAVAKSWRGRGIAAALIGRSFDTFRSEGFTHAMLGVDTDSPTGAGGLYRKLGFRSLHRTVTSELEVPRVTP